MDELQTAVAMAQTILRAKYPGPPYARSAIEEAADAAIRTITQLELAPPARDILLAELEMRHSISIGIETMLVGDEPHVKWYTGDRSEPGPFAARYFTFLRDIEGWSDEPVKALRKSTATIVSQLEDPTREGPWDRRGLVVGHVQSGKTASYAGVICRAADAGYRLIIVLAGMHNALRAQTQMRLDRDFVGYESSGAAAGGRKPIGVSDVDDRPVVHLLTNREMNGDFNRRRAETANLTVTNEPFLLVLKKNASVLKNLNEWVRDVLARRGVTTRAPLLVIDDEADQASIDTGAQAQDIAGEFDPDYDPTRINAQIRKLLHAFNRKAYIAYTATPFANILIHDEAVAADYGDDLFPRSFIVNLPAPSNYVGPQLLFGPSAQSPPLFTRSVEQTGEGWIEDRHRSDFRPTYRCSDTIPPSLEKALLSFVLACAARRARGQLNKHNSMLIHVSRFKDVQARVHEQVRVWMEDIEEKVSLGVGGVEVLQRLEALWSEEFIGTSKRVRSEVEWSETPDTAWAAVSDHVIPVLRDIEVRLVNSDITQPLDYDLYPNGLSVIAVGGDKLSRGLTLEGLSVSYFLRASKMYDSLMQMGRWFGYRPGYLDLCRIYLPDDLKQWFEHVAKASEDFRQQLDYMAAINATPKEYGLSVQTHEVLAITARNKRRHGSEFDLSYSGQIKIPTLFSTVSTDIERNARLVADFIAAIGPHEEQDVSGDKDISKRFIWRSVRGKTVSDLIAAFGFHKDAIEVVGGVLARYIDEQLAHGELKDWTVAIPTGRGQHVTIDGIGSVPSVARNPIKDESRAGLYKVQTVLSPPDEAIDLDDDQRREALRKTNETRLVAGKSEVKLPGGVQIRGERPVTRGLLILYPLSPRAVDVESDTPIYAPVISFPRSPTARTIRVVANSVFMREFVG